MGSDGIDQLSGQELADELTKVIQGDLVTAKSSTLVAIIPDANGVGTATSATLGITRDLGEGNPNYLAVPVGQ